MKKRFLAITLVLCMLLPMIPFSTLALAPVDGLVYDSAFARDVVFGNVPIWHWYEGLAGSEYQNGYDAGTHAFATDYETYITAFDEMVGFGDVVIDAGTVVSDGFDAEEWYADIPQSLVREMNTVSDEYGEYITREIWGKAHKWCKDIDNFVEGSNIYATRATQYIYSYTFDPTQEVGYVGPTNLPKMIINTGNQSDEKGAIFGTYYLLYDILNNWEKDPVLDYLRHNVILVIVPCETPGGMNNGNTYWNANYININRNFNVNFNQMGGYSFVADEDGEWVAYQTTVTGGAGSKTATCYKKAEDGNGDYTRITDVDGHYNEKGLSIIAESQIYTQNSGHAPFDQSEACVLRDLLAKNSDAFYYTDYHTQTSGCLGLDKSGKTPWSVFNWQAIGTQPDDYGRKLLNAASWHIDRMTDNFVRQYDLKQYGYTEGTSLGYISTSDGYGNSNVYARSQNILATTLESISGFPKVPDGNGGSTTIYGGRYSPTTQKLCSEVLGNWLIAILGEYAYQGNFPTDTYSTSFNADMTGNYPTIGNFSSTADLPRQDGVANGGFWPLSKLKNADGTEKYPLIFNGNWSVGYKKINGVGTFNNNPDNFTPYGIYVQQNASSMSLFFAGDTTVWSTSARIVFNPNSQMSTSTNKTAYGGSSTNQTAVYGNDATIRYTAEYDGAITVNIENLLFETNTCQLVILKNGVEIGRIQPVKESCGSFVSADGVWTRINGSQRLSGSFTTTVQAGDHIDFVNHNNVSDDKATCSWPLTYDMMTQNNYKYADGKSVGNIWELYRAGAKDYRINISYTVPVINEIEADYNGKTGALSWTYPTDSGKLETFLTWYNASGNVISANGSLTGATAKINPDLISAGWIKSTDSWEQAIEGYFNYLRSLSAVTSPSGWVVGAMEGDTPFVKGSNFSPINRYVIFDNAFNLFSVSSSGTYTPRYGFERVANSENYFEAQLAILKNAASLVTTTKQASEITIPYQASFATTLLSKGYKVGKPNSGEANAGHGTAVAMIDMGSTNVDYSGTLLRPHSDARTGIATVSYVVPSGMEKGMATLTLNNLYYLTNTSDHYFSLYLVSGDTETALIPQMKVSASTSATTIQAKLAELGSFEVKAGDRIDVRFGRISGASFMTPDLSLDIVRCGDRWAGNYGNENTIRTSYETFFKWYDGATGAVIANNGAVTNDDYMLINPYFTAENATYKITPDMTYREAIAVYKQYLRSYAAGMATKNNWQLVSMEGANPQTYGTNLVPIMYPDILERENAFALAITEKSSGVSTPTWAYPYVLASDGSGKYDNAFRNPDVWVSAAQFETQMQLFFDEVYYDRTAKVFKNVENSAIAWDAKVGTFDAVGENGLTFDKISAYRTEDNVYKEYEVPYAWNSNGGNWPIGASCTAVNDSDAAYKGMHIRPQSGQGGGVMYTVPAGKAGSAVLVVNGLHFGDNGGSTLNKATFKWNVLVNGVEQFAEWQTATKTEEGASETLASARVQAINAALATLSLRVKAGDTVAFCIKNSGSKIYVSPSIEITVTNDLVPLRRVQYASGSVIANSELAAAGSSIADLIAAYRKTDADFAVNGCYVNGVWYEANAELPEIDADNVILDDMKMETAASVGIGATYKANVYLSALAGASEAGVYIHGKKLPATLQENGTWRVTVSEVYAKEVLDACVIYTPYYVVDGDEAVCAKYTLIRIKDLLAEYVAGDYATADKALAQAALDYATVAKTYFAKETAPIDVLSRLTACDDIIAAEKSAMRITAGEKYTFTAASLQIGNTINFVLAIGNKDGSNLTSLDEALTVDGTGISVNEFMPTSIKGQKMMAAVITGVPESKFAESLTFRVADASLVYSVKDYCVRSFASAAEAEKNMIRAVYTIGAAASGEHIHYFGDPTLVYEGGVATKETVTCLHGDCGEQLTRPIPTLTMEYQDTLSFNTPVLGIEKENVISTVTGTETPDTNVLVAEGTTAVYATGVGKAYVRTQTGYYIVEVTPAVINMLFLSGQSNAEGAPASGDVMDSSLYNYADYARFYKRSPDKMAYFTYGNQQLDITGTDYTPDMYVVKTLKWGSEARYSNVAWRGANVTTLCDEDGDFSAVGICAGLAYEWVKQTDERVWVVNSSHGGHPIQNFLPIGTEGTLYNPEVPEARYNDYEQAVAIYQLALQTMQNEINAGHFTLNHMVFYWFQGESDNSSTDAYYMECFERLYSELQKDVKLGDKTLDFAGLFTVRSCKDNLGNSRAELQMTATRLADYEMAASQSEIFDNVYCVTNATERWTGEDANVEEYFLDVYGSAENFEAIFGYPMPTKLGQMHPNIHYAIYGQNEMGVDAARNSLMILNDLYGAEYDLSYDDLNATTKVTLVNYDGYTPATEVILSDSKEYGYVIPMVTPLYRMARGVTLSVDPASGFAFDGFRIYVQDGFARKDLADEITVTVRVGDEIAGVYTLDVVFATSEYLDGEKTMAQYGNSQNPPRQDIVIQKSVWQYGYVDYTDGSFHEFDYYDESNGWYYATGDKLWTDSAGTFHGAYNKSQGMAMARSEESGVGLAYRISETGRIKLHFDSVNATANDMDFAIFVNGVCVWPTVSEDYTDHTDWYRIYNGGTDGETKTTAVTLNEVLADVELQVKEGDLVVFVFEYVDGRAKAFVAPSIRYAKEEE